MPKESKYAQAEYIKTIHEDMLRTQNLFKPKGYTIENQSEVTREDRKILIDWLLIVQIEFKLLPETMQTTVNLIDKYLSLNQVSIDDFQLLGVTAMFTASKFHDLHPHMVSDFILVTKNSFTVDQLLAMETSILSAVEFDLHMVLPCTLLESYCIAINAVEDNATLVYANYLIDLSLLEIDFLQFDSQIVVIVALAMGLSWSI